MFQEVVSMIGLPHRANDEPDFRGVKLPICEETFSTYMLPPFEDFGEYNKKMSGISEGNVFKMC